MELIRKIKRRQAQEEENPYWMSFSDIMAGILIIFIIVCAVLVYKLAQTRESFTETEERVRKNIEQLQEALQAREIMLNEVKEILKTKGLYVDVEDDSIIVPMTTLDFASGSFKISEGKNEQAAEALGTALRDVLCKDDRWKYLETIFVEGHTDSVSADNRYRMGNWELSALRAISLWKFWTEERAEEFGQALKDMGHRVVHEGIEKRAALFSVSGYADTRRREMEDVTDEQRRRNRRINIRFVTKQIHPEELEIIRRLLEHDNG